MGRPLSDRELKRVSRVMSGHLNDKDRARWKRKATGQAAPMKPPRKPSGEEGDESEAPGQDDEQ